MKGEIADLSRRAPPADTTVDILVIGSGCGGATAAWDLARAGREVLVLEEGGDRTGLDLTQRDSIEYDDLYMDRAGRATEDLAITILQGRALGGGGVINCSDVVPIHDPVLRVWQRRFGLTGFSPEALAPYTKRALEDLHANEPREDQLNRNNLLLRDGARHLGWRGEVMKHNRVGCSGLGTCMIGCPADAKMGPRFVAIPGALKAGARFWLRARAVRIEDASAELKTVRVRRLDPTGHREVDGFTVRARRVILAANAIASAQLLIRSGIGNEHVGRHLSLQPQLPVTAIFDEEVRFFRGIPQAYAVTQFEDLDHAQHGFWGFRVEAISGTPGIVASLLPRLGHEGKELMRLYPRMASVLCLLPDEPKGEVRVERSGRLRVRYALDEEQKARFRVAAKAAARLFFAAGAREVMVPCVPLIALRSPDDLPLIDAMSLEPCTAPLVSAHQQGAVRFSTSARDGGADPSGQVWGTRGIHVLDSSGFPTSASSHTMAPIIAVSHFLAAQIS